MPNNDSVQLCGPAPLDGRPSASPSALVRVEIGARTHPGKVRSNNEDHFIVTRADRTLEALATNLPTACLPTRTNEAGYGFMVADGMGGALAGEVASRTAISTFLKILLDSPAWFLNFSEDHGQVVMQRMADRFRQIAAALSEVAQATPNLHGMGTTMTLACSAGPDLIITHVGDSRAYLFRKGQLKLLTHDQTLAEELAVTGAIAREDIATHRYRHVLTQAVGRKGGNLDVQVGRFRLQDGDLLMVCTDGLTEMVKEEAIAKVFASTGPVEEASQKLIDLALENGGRDNVTVVLARYHIPEEANRPEQACSLSTNR